MQLPSYPFALKRGRGGREHPESAGYLRADPRLRETPTADSGTHFGHGSIFAVGRFFDSLAFSLAFCWAASSRAKGGALKSTSCGNCGPGRGVFSGNGRNSDKVNVRGAEAAGRVGGPFSPARLVDVNSGRRSSGPTLYPGLLSVTDVEYRRRYLVDPFRRSNRRVPRCGATHHAHV